MRSVTRGILDDPSREARIIRGLLSLQSDQNIRLRRERERERERDRERERESQCKKRNIERCPLYYKRFHCRSQIDGVLYLELPIQEASL